MSTVTYEGIVQGGRIRLKGNVHLPENARVYVVVPDVDVERVARVSTPHLVNREQTKDFNMEVVEDSNNDGL
jgi:hypothetical protein